MAQNVKISIVNSAFLQKQLVLVLTGTRGHRCVRACHQKLSIELERRTCFSNANISAGMGIRRRDDKLLGGWITSLPTPSTVNLCTVRWTEITPDEKSMSDHRSAHNSPKRKPLFNVSKIAIPRILGTSSTLLAMEFISASEKISGIFCRYFGSFAPCAGLLQLNVVSAYFKTPFNNVPISFNVFCDSSLSICFCCKKM